MTCLSLSHSHKIKLLFLPLLDDHINTAGALAVSGLPGGPSAATVLSGLPGGLGEDAQQTPPVGEDSPIVRGLSVPVDARFADSHRTRPRAAGTSLHELFVGEHQVGTSSHLINCLQP